MSIIGIIAGILGIVGSGYTFVEGMDMPATESSMPIFLALIALGLVIVGLIGATLKSKNKLAGELMLMGFVGGLLTMASSLSVSKTPIPFLIGIVTIILFLISGIMSLKSKNGKEIES